MPTPHGRPGLGLPVLLSLAGHGLLVLALALAPGNRPAPRPRMVVETCVLSLGSPAPPNPAPEPDREEPHDFTATVVAAPAPAAAAAEAGAAPVVVFPRPPSTGASGSGAPSPRPGGGGAGVAASRPGLFEPAAPGRRVVFLLDRSLSMGLHGALDRARRELLAHLARLPPSARFAVVPYSSQAEPLRFNGDEYVPPDADSLRQVALVLNGLTASGSTRHGWALRRGLALRPDVLYLITDADELTAIEVDEITRANRGQAAIHAVELRAGRETPADSPLRLLARRNGGTYRRVAPEE